MARLSLLCRLAISVPPPRYHTVKYAGVLAPASPWRARISPRLTRTLATSDPEMTRADPDLQNDAKPKRGGYRAWADLLRRTFAVDVLACPECKGRMMLITMVTEPKSVTRFLAALGELVDVPARSPSRGPPYWRGTVLPHKALGHVA